VHFELRQPSWDDDSEADDALAPPEAAPTPWAQRWRERHPEASEEDLAAVSAERVKKMEAMKQAYCRSKFHFFAWSVHLLLVLVLCASALGLEVDAQYHDPFECHRPLLVWAAALVWTLLVVEPAWAFVWALHWHIVDGINRHDPWWLLINQWGPDAKDAMQSFAVWLYESCALKLMRLKPRKHKRRNRFKVDAEDDVDDDELDEDEKAEVEAAVQAAVMEASPKNRRGSSSRKSVTMVPPPA